MVESLDGYSRYYDGAQVAALERDTTGRYRGIGVVFRPPLDSARVLFALPGSPRTGRIAARGQDPRGGRRAERGAGRSGPAAGHRRVQRRHPGVGGSSALGRHAHPETGARRTRRPERAPRPACVDPTLGVGYLAITLVQPGDRRRVRCRGGVHLQLQGRGAGPRRARQPGRRAAFRRAHRQPLPRPRPDRLARRAAASPRATTRCPPRRRSSGTAAWWSWSMPSRPARAKCWRPRCRSTARAVLVGGKTYGKGMVQQVRAFGDGRCRGAADHGLLLHAGAHATSSARCRRAREHGLMPDVRVELPRGGRRPAGLSGALQPPESTLEELRGLGTRSRGSCRVPPLVRDAAIGGRPGPVPRRARRGARPSKSGAEGLVLGIESSCDETAAAVVRAGGRCSRRSSQARWTLHAPYGGVVPEIAGRSHLRAILPTVDRRARRSRGRARGPGAIAVTARPG
jgi:hypothetical protein